VPTLSEPASLVIPKGTQHGTLFKIQGAGLPNLRTGRKGDLAIVTRIEVPKKLNDRQQKLLREYAEMESDHGILPETTSFWKKMKEFIGG
jgi:molecular chaperone DnaJ